jgi:hypothetical protein
MSTITNRHAMVDARQLERHAGPLLLHIFEGLMVFLLSSAIGLAAVSIAISLFTGGTDPSAVIV